jgi:hypothetical protein
MEPRQIEQYTLAWHPQKGSHYRIKLLNGPWGQWVSISTADMAALGTLFKEKPVFLHPDGTISIGPEPVGN